MDFPEAAGLRELHYDAEWLAVLRTTHSLMSLQRRPVTLPGVDGGQHLNKVAVHGHRPAASANEVSLRSPAANSPPLLLQRQTRLPSSRNVCLQSFVVKCTLGH